MKNLARVYASLRALIVAGFAGGAAVAHAQGVDPGEDRAWQEARERGDPQGFERYLELYPVGPHADQAYRCIIEISTGGRPPADSASARGVCGDEAADRASAAGAADARDAEAIEGLAPGAAGGAAGRTGGTDRRAYRNTRGLSVDLY